MPRDVCPLCGTGSVVFYLSDLKREYFHCDNCELVFVPEKYHLNPVQEKAEYDKHRNSADDPGYRQFLNRLCLPLLERLPPLSSGLDFGCGPGPALPAMLREQGHSLEVFDKFYASDTSVLEKRYDFVTATEVLEHLSRPAQTLDQLWSLVKPGGMLGVMTKQVTNKAAFNSWHYKNDPTHIVFFSANTLVWLSTQWNAGLEFVANDAIIFTKPNLQG